MERVKIISSKFFDRFNDNQPITLLKHFNKIKSISQNTENFDFYFSNAAVYSSMIEGNRIDFDSYLKYSHSGMNNTGKSFKEIEDLKMGYRFAKDHQLNLINFLKCHKILVNTIIEDTKYKGKIRDRDVYVFANGKKIFTGAGKDIVKDEVVKLFHDISLLISRDLTINQVFYYASMIHLIFVEIHPFADGNGRCARLIEKWFLYEKLGVNAWFIQSERLYQERLVSYYKNVHLGDNYNNINYDLSIPFLLMLPMSLRLH